MLVRCDFPPLSAKIGAFFMFYNILSAFSCKNICRYNKDVIPLHCQTKETTLLTIKTQLQ